MCAWGSSRVSSPIQILAERSKHTGREGFLIHSRIIPGAGANIRNEQWLLAAGSLWQLNQWMKQVAELGMDEKV